MKEILAQVQANLEEMLDKYDEAAQDLLEIAHLDGHFDDRELSDLTWPRTARPGEKPDIAALALRSSLIRRIYEGTPPRRDRRLLEAFEKHQRALSAYHEANRIFLQIKCQFIDEGLGSEQDFLQLYQSHYLRVLGRENPLPLDRGEAGLVEFRVARAPLSHAQSVAEKLRTDDIDGNAAGNIMRYELDGKQVAVPLGEALAGIAERVVDALAAGEHLAIRYNTFSNFVWFGISVWRVIADIELLLAHLKGRVAHRWHCKLTSYVQLAQAMMLKFLQAHLEDPAQIRPKEYWYGQEYSYLTRDLIDLVRSLIDGANRLRSKARGLDLEVVPAVAPVPLLDGGTRGRFLEFDHVGRRGVESASRRWWRLASWLRVFRRRVRQTKALSTSGLSPAELRATAWRNAVDWGRRTLDVFGIQVRIVIDSQFAAVAEQLDLSGSGHRIVFMPTHQSLMDHPAMYHVLASDELMAAMGWSEPVSCCLLARSGLTDPGSIRVGSRRISLLGIDSESADELMQEVDGYVIIDRNDESARPAADFAKIIDERPGVAYAAGTTSSFDLQILPMQHALFAYLPHDVIIVPIALRGIHSLWPKCPKGNVDIGSGLVEAVVSPPMVGETTLLPRKRALRTQLEPATLFQAVHIATLLDPETQ